MKDTQSRDEHVQSLAVLLGGCTITVTHLDNTPEQVLVKQLSIRELPQYAAVIEDEAASIMLFTGKDSAWVDSLAIQSAEQILDEGERLNLDFLSRHAARITARREKMLPGLQDKIIEKVIARLKPNQSPNGLPGAQPNAD
jgi:hypothetical protein